MSARSLARNVAVTSTNNIVPALTVTVPPDSIPAAEIERGLALRSIQVSNELEKSDDFLGLSSCSDDHSLSLRLDDMKKNRVESKECLKDMMVDKRHLFCKIWLLKAKIVYFKQ